MSGIVDVVVVRISWHQHLAGVVTPAAARVALAFATLGAAPYLVLNASVAPASPCGTIEYNGCTVDR